MILSIPKDFSSPRIASYKLSAFYNFFLNHLLIFTSHLLHIFFIKLMKLSSLKVPRDLLRISWVWCSFDNSGVHPGVARPDPVCFPVHGPMLEAESSCIYLHADRFYQNQTKHIHIEFCLSTKYILLLGPVFLMILLLLASELAFYKVIC